METTKNSPQKSKIFDPFHGGRNLSAVYAMDNLTGIETAIMIFIGGRLDFRDFAHSKVTASTAEISQEIKFSRNAVKNGLRGLSEKSFLFIENNFDERGFKIENTYSITDYFFQCYKEKMLCHVVDGLEKAIDGLEKASNLPLFNDPEFEAERSEEEKKEPIKNARDGHSPSLCQEDARGLDNSFVSDKEEKTKPRVTAAHNKMVILFTPRPELKSYVHRNTILALTDELIGKHGKMAVKAINRLYDDLIAEDLCGKFEWSVKRTLSFFNEALEKIE
jgi:hypothetical protein